jgi:Predicted membrane protein
MYCQECKKQNEEDAVYCEHCGSLIIKDSSADIIIDSNREEVRKKRKKRKFMRDYGFIIMQALICIGLIIAFVMIGNKTYSVEKYVQNYFESVADGAWEEVYEYLVLPDSEYLSKSNFVKSMAEVESFSYSDYTVEVVENDSDYTTVKILYILTDTQEKNTLLVNMQKSKSKAFLFFPVWKVEGTAFLAVDTKIQIPDGASIILNEVPLDGDIIQIPYLFAGSHLLKVSKKDMNGTSEVIQIPAGRGYTHVAGALKVQESIKEEMFAVAARSLNNIFSAALNQKEFAYISNLFVSDKIVNEQMRSEYEAFAKELCDEDGYGVKNISFKNVNASLTTSETEEVVITVILNAEYTYSAQMKKDVAATEDVNEETENETEISVSEIKTGSGNYTTTMEFVEEGENWLLRSYEFNIPAVK